MANPEMRPRQDRDRDEIDAARSDFGKYRHGEKVTPYGSARERKKRPEVDPKHNYGGRTERPDPDVNDTPHVEEDDEETDSRDAASADGVYSSPLPARAFDKGDLFADRTATPAATAGEARRSVVHALLARFSARLRGRA